VRTPTQNHRVSDESRPLLIDIVEVLIGQNRRIGKDNTVVLPAARRASRCCACRCLLLWTAHQAK